MMVWFPNNVLWISYSQCLLVWFAGIYTIRKSVSNSPLPSPRFIGNYVNQINAYKKAPSPVANYGSLLIGQFIAHDVGLRDTIQNSMYSKFERSHETKFHCNLSIPTDIGGPSLSCCSRDQSHQLPATETYFGCEAIEIPNDDPFYGQFNNKRCMSYMRSQPTLANDCSMDTTEIVSKAVWE